MKRVIARKPKLNVKKSHNN